MVAITNIEQLGFTGQEIRVIFKNGTSLTGHGTMRADRNLIDLRDAGGGVREISLADGTVQEVLCSKELDEWTSGGPAVCGRGCPRDAEPAVRDKAASGI